MRLMRAIEDGWRQAVEFARCKAPPAARRGPRPARSSPRRRPRAIRRTARGSRRPWRCSPRRPGRCRRAVSSAVTSITRISALLIAAASTTWSADDAGCAKLRLDGVRHRRLCRELPFLGDGIERQSAIRQRKVERLLEERPVVFDRHPGRAHQHLDVDAGQRRGLDLLERRDIALDSADRSRRRRGHRRACRRRRRTDSPRGCARHRRLDRARRSVPAPRWLPPR